jgi:type IV pilus assembly protein PilY1
MRNEFYIKTKIQAVLLQKMVFQSFLLFSNVLILSSAFALSDLPLKVDPLPPNNVLLALSVEEPTALENAHQGNYSNIKAYSGYFDSNKCYRYVENLTQRNKGYFAPFGNKNSSNYGCPSARTNKTWSGNFLNFATTPVIDVMRQVLTGGYRDEDTTTSTILQKGWMNTDSTPYFEPVQLTNATMIARVAPVNWSQLCVSVSHMGLRFVFNDCSTRIEDASDVTDAYPTGTSPSSGQIYQMYARVKVCDGSSPLALEKNCEQFPNGQYKPIGLLQKYASSGRFGVFGYLNQIGDTLVENDTIDGGVMRAALDYIGPKKNISPTQQGVVNSQGEWDANTGQFILNPRSTDSASTTTSTGVSINQSGVINYLNQFGLDAQSYEKGDNLSELFYAATRYYRGLPNVPSWTALRGDVNQRKRWLDGFPVVVDWPNNSIQASCQKNYILGVGDAFTWMDYTVPGSTLASASAVAQLNDTAVNARIRTNQVGRMEFNTQFSNGYQLTDPNLGEYWLLEEQRGTSFIAGLAYDAHTRDQRTDFAGNQTISTFWLDVIQDSSSPDITNQYVLAAKYGGFKVPDGFDPDTYNNAPLNSAWWSKSGADISVNGVVPDYYPTDSAGDPANYFRAGNADDMYKGLEQAFTTIFKEQYAVNSLALASPNVLHNGSMSYQVDYISGSWISRFYGKKVNFDSQGVPSFTSVWDASALLDAQATRFIATNNGNTARIGPNSNRGVAFQLARITDADLLNSLGSVATQSNVLNYLRGSRSNESPVGVYRKRDGLLGDIVNAQPVVVTKPDASYLDSTNPGYSTFKNSKIGRATVVYLASNDGMLHAFNGMDPAIDANGGKELFAYVPSFAFVGPNNTPSIDGLLALTNPNYQHRFYIDATPSVTDVDMNRAGLTSQTVPNWQTLLVGGLGKGGRGYFALDVTDPVVTSETELASKVKWEFSDSDMGFSAGKPIIVKTKQYGWVVIFTSGYETPNGNSYFYIVDPNNGRLLQKISTSTGSQQTGLAHAAAFVPNFSDYTADAVYAGDLLGNVWRLDLTAAAGDYPNPTLIAQLTDNSGNPQPITTAPLIEIDPETNRRLLMIGTGKLLDVADLNNNAIQSFYAFIDGNSSKFTSSETIRRDQLTYASDLINGLPFKATVGWYLDFPASERMLMDSRPFNGYVSFVTYKPTENYCGEDVTVRGGAYLVQMNNAKSQLIGIARTDLTVPVSTVSIIRTPDAIIRLYTTNKNGEVLPIESTINSNGLKLFKELNWRQVLSRD